MGRIAGCFEGELGEIWAVRKLKRGKDIKISLHPLRSGLWCRELRRFINLIIGEERWPRQRLREYSGRHRYSPPER
jgi:hypothetical protein